MDKCNTKTISHYQIDTELMTILDENKEEMQYNTWLPTGGASGGQSHMTAPHVLTHARVIWH